MSIWIMAQSLYNMLNCILYRLIFIKLLDTLCPSKNQIDNI